LSFGLALSTGHESLGEYLDDPLLLFLPVRLLLGLITGSEGLLGVVTEVTVRILRGPEGPQIRLVLVGKKLAIVPDKPQTTRTQIRGVRTTVGGFLPNAAVSAIVPPGRRTISPPRIDGSSFVTTVTARPAVAAVRRHPPQRHPHQAADGTRPEPVRGVTPDRHHRGRRLQAQQHGEDRDVSLEKPPHGRSVPDAVPPPG